MGAASGSRAGPRSVASGGKSAMSRRARRRSSPSGTARDGSGTPRCRGVLRGGAAGGSRRRRRAPCRRHGVSGRAARRPGRSGSHSMLPRVSFRSIRSFVPLVLASREKSARRASARMTRAFATLVRSRGGRSRRRPSPGDASRRTAHRRRRRPSRSSAPTALQLVAALVDLGPPWSVSAYVRRSPASSVRMRPSSTSWASAG